jgi:Protein of unknown function (DUF2939)
MGRKRIVGAVVVLLVLFAAVWLASPVLTARAVIQAAKDGDEARLEQHVDFPSLRASLKDELGARLSLEMRDDPRLSGGLGGLGMLLAPSLVSGAVDALVTPRAVAFMVQEARAPEPADAVRPVEAWGYRDLNTFAVTLWREDRPDDRLALLLERRGLFGWKLAAVDLTPDGLD